MNTQTLPDREKLAVAFLDVLEEWLSPEQQKQVAIDNATEQDPSICHTHDVCNANQAMIDAWEKLNGPEMDCQDDAHIARITGAWKDAKALILKRWL